MSDRASHPEGDATESLHVFHNDYEWVAAYSVEEAIALATELMGPREEEEEWKRLPDDAAMRVWLQEQTGEVGDGSSDCVLVGGTMAAWAEAFGPGYICCSEY